METNVEQQKATDAHNAMHVLEEAREKLRSFSEHARAYIKEHPTACLIGAVAFGYVLARLARRWS